MTEQNQLKTNHDIRVVTLTTGERVLCLFGEIRNDEEDRVLGYRLLYPFTLELGTPNDDGTIPDDNPFINDSNAIKAIYSYGHRNPQGIFKNPDTGEIWTNEHGPRGGDEINIIKKGVNYGWPKITYGINYSGTTITKDKKLPGMAQPLYYWLPSIAPSSFEYISSDVYPGWKGSMLAGALVFKYVERIGVENDKVVYRSKIAEGLGRPRDIKQGPDGYIYVAMEKKGVYKIVPKRVMPK